MNRNKSISHGAFYLSDAVIHVENALIEEVRVENESRGYVLVSLKLYDDNNIKYMQEVRLNVGDDTIIIDEKGRMLNLYDIEKGMQIDADISSLMTRSIPPQSFAYRIVVLDKKASVTIKTDRVVGVDTDNGFLLTGNPYDMNDQFLFTISSDTVILDKNNNIISLNEIQPGLLVRVEYAIFQTLSIPPQSPAYRVQII
ncbi:MAG: hypothetical protein QM217_09100 [Bacillota bacterium]|nr:hypothetical protein [Bacillota bacterium]